MISCKDLEKVYFLYQTEGAPKGISIDSFCLQNVFIGSKSEFFVHL